MPNPAPRAAEIFRVLLVEDNPDDVFLLHELVEQTPGSRFQIVSETGRLDSGIAALQAGGIDAILLDLTLPDSRGVETFNRMHEVAPHIPIIVLSGLNDEELALETVHLGAQEYLVKGQVDTHLLHRALRYAIERSRAETALAHERDLLHTLLENIPDRIYFKDEKSRFIRINRALTSLLGLERPEEAYGKSDADFYDASHAQEALEDERRVMQTGHPILGKVEKEELAYGRRSWSLTTKLPLRDHTGRVVGTCGISREITKLKEMEEQLATERHFLRSVIDNLPDFIYLKDVEGRYLLDNAAHRRWLGFSDPTEVLGKSVFDFYPPVVAQHLHDDDVAIFQSDMAMVNHEERLTDRTGEVRWVLTTKVPWRDDDGEVLGLVCISRDITGQKVAEENLKQAYADLARSREDVLGAMSKLQNAHSELRQVQLQLIEAEKMKSIGRLAAGVAHEVKNPLAILKMGIDFLTSIEISDDSAPLILREMSDAVQRADSVIRGLLDFSAPKKLEVYPEDLNLIIDGALKLVRGEMKGASCEIIRELQPDLPEVQLDAAKISQVFINLFTNAMHAMDGGGTLSVRTFSKQLTGVGANIADQRSESFRVGQTIVVAEIDDSGHGIPEDKLNKIFEPFFTTKPTGTGTGLGLSVVKTIVDLHGGTIDLRNRHEGGVRVTLMFQV